MNKDCIPASSLENDKAMDTKFYAAPAKLLASEWPQIWKLGNLKNCQSQEKLKET